MSSEDIGNLQKRTPQGQEAANSKDEKIPRNEAMKALHETPLEGLLKLATRAQLDETELRAVLNTRRANELRSTTQPSEHGRLLMRWLTLPGRAVRLRLRWRTFSAMCLSACPTCRQCWM